MPKKKRRKVGKKKAASSKGSRGRSSKSSKRSKSRSKSSKRSKRKKSRSKTPTQVNDGKRESVRRANQSRSKVCFELIIPTSIEKWGQMILKIALPYISHWNNLQKIYLYGHGFNDIRRQSVSLAKSPIIDELDISYNSIGSIQMCARLVLLRNAEATVDQTPPLRIAPGAARKVLKSKCLMYHHYHRHL